MEPMPKEIAAALGLVSGTTEKIVKDGINQHGDYKFASTDAFFRMIKPACAEANLLIKPRACDVRVDVMDITDRHGKAQSRRMVFATYTFVFIHTETGVMWCDDMDRRTVAIDFTGPQSFAAAESYATKTFLRTLFLIATGDKDADAQEQFEAEVTKAKVRAAKIKNETGVEQINLDFGDGLEPMPAADVPNRVMQHLASIGPEDGAEWWKTQELGRKAFADQFPKLAFDLRKKVEKFLATQEQAA